MGYRASLSDWHCTRRKHSFSASLFHLSLPSLLSTLLFSALLPSLSFSFSARRSFVSPCLLQPRPHSLAPSLCAVMKISQTAAHNGVPTSGAQTPQILLQAAKTTVVADPLYIHAPTCTHVVVPFTHTSTQKHVHCALCTLPC